MIRKTYITTFCIALSAWGCSDDDDVNAPTAGSGGTMPTAGTGGSTGGVGGSSTAGTAGSAGSSMAGSGGMGNGGSLCLTYGGPSGVASVVQNQVLGIIMSDCRINSFFTVLSDEAATHLSECLVIQFQEVFGCPGVTYAGSQDSSGAACRDMATAHASLGISDGGFGAMIDAIGAGLSIGGVQGPDVAQVVGAIYPTAAQIVDVTAGPGPTRVACDQPDAGAGDAGATDDAGSAGDASTSNGDAGTPASSDAGDGG